MRPSTRYLGFGAFALFAACGEPPVAATAPIVPTAATFDENNGGCASNMIICESDGSVNPNYVPPPDYVEDTFYDVPVEAEHLLSVSQADYDLGLSNLVCMTDLLLSAVPATLFPPGEAPLTIVSTGLARGTTFPMPIQQRRYRWPPDYSNAGYWPEEGPNGRLAYIETGDAKCAMLLRNGQPTLVHTFFNYNNVRIKYPTRRTSSGGGSIGGGPPCDVIWLSLEVNYGDGRGWLFLWEGEAMECG
jgi:hypothetical protein